MNPQPHSCNDASDRAGYRNALHTRYNLDHIIGRFIKKEPKSGMPLWLATWVFSIAEVACILLTSVFVVVMHTNDVAYITGGRTVVAAIVATPWLWYFGYIRYRYFDKTYRLYYPIWAAPAILYFVDIGRAITIWSYYKYPYYVWLDVSMVITWCVYAFIVYEVYYGLRKGDIR